MCLVEFVFDCQTALAANNVSELEMNHEMSHWKTSSTDIFIRSIVSSTGYGIAYTALFMDCVVNVVNLELARGLNFSVKWRE